MKSQTKANGKSVKAVAPKDQPLKSIVDFKMNQEGTKHQIVIKKDWRSDDGKHFKPAAEDRYPIVMGVDRARWILKHAKDLEAFVADHPDE